MLSVNDNLSPAERVALHHARLAELVTTAEAIDLDRLGYDRDYLAWAHRLAWGIKQQKNLLLAASRDLINEAPAHAS